MMRSLFVLLASLALAAAFRPAMPVRSRALAPMRMSRDVEAVTTAACVTVAVAAALQLSAAQPAFAAAPPAYMEQTTVSLSFDAEKAKANAAELEAKRAAGKAAIEKATAEKAAKAEALRLDKAAAKAAALAKN